MASKSIMCYCVPGFLGLAATIMSNQLPLCRSSGCPANHPPKAHGFPATIHPCCAKHNCVKIVAVQPPSTQSPWLSSHHSQGCKNCGSWLSSHHSPMLCKTQLCKNCGCPATIHPNKANGFPATIPKAVQNTIVQKLWLSSHHPKLMAFQPPFTHSCAKHNCVKIVTHPKPMAFQPPVTQSFFHSLSSPSSSIPGSQIPFKTRWKAN